MPRPSPTPRSAPPHVAVQVARGGGPAGAAAASRPAVPAPRAERRTAAPPAPPDDDAVTELVAGPARRGRAGVADGPGTGRVPGLVGLVLGVLALLASVVVAADPAVLGRFGASPLAPVVPLVTALLATACAGLGAGRHRAGRGVAVTGVVVGLAGVAAAVVPLLAL